MLCDYCKKNEATVHMTSVVNNQKQESHLCNDCANVMQKSGKFSPFGSFGTDMWDNNFFTNDFFKNMVYPDSILKGKQQSICPGCGITYDDFNQSGKFGCSQCYDAFSREIEPLLQRIQGSTVYGGRVPNRGNSKLKAKHEMKRLRSQLDTAIKTENFEEAAHIRDVIKNLEQQVGKTNQ